MGHLSKSNSESNSEIQPSIPSASILSDRQRDLLERLSALDPDMMTPREALDALYALKAEEQGKEKMPDWVEE